MSLRRINEYRTMWIFVFFDLPTETKKQRKAAAIFRKSLLMDGFAMFQFSVYIRCCPSRENAEVHIKRTKTVIPETGEVCILHITDKQFGNMELFYSKQKKKLDPAYQQLELF